MSLKNNTLLQGGKYKIIRFINSGGFGCTYEAEHTLFKTHVAIKEFFKDDLCNRDERTNKVSVGVRSKAETVAKLKKKFLEEATSVFQMKHPGIVRVIDIFEENGTAYYVMDFIDGCSLSDLVKRRGKLPEKEALHYILQVVEALQYVHARNRLHLDIKPGNIMVDKHGRAILIDFGASKHYNENSGKQDSTLLGINTPGYTPVEQAARNFSKFNPATDIYALGATLYTLLTGIPPTASILRADEDDESEIFNYLPSSVSTSTKKALEAAMQIRSINRPQNLEEFKKMLGANTAYKEKTVYDDLEDTVEATVVDVEKTSESKKRKSFWSKQETNVEPNKKRKNKINGNADNTIIINEPLINMTLFFKYYIDLFLLFFLFFLLHYMPSIPHNVEGESLIITSTLFATMHFHYKIKHDNIYAWFGTFLLGIILYLIAFFCCAFCFAIISDLFGIKNIYFDTVFIFLTTFISIKLLEKLVEISKTNVAEEKELNIKEKANIGKKLFSIIIMSYLVIAYLIWCSYNNKGRIFLECNLSAFIIYLLLGLYSWKRYNRPII